MKRVHRGRWIELVSLILTIPLVIAIFRGVEERRVAATIAGSLFISIGFLQVFLESRYGRREQSLLYWNAWIFLVGAAFPILGLRLLNWNLPFDETALLGIPGPLFHEVSNWIYLMMIVTTIVEMGRDHFDSKAK